jgi:hypothetical protein
MAPEEDKKFDAVLAAYLSNDFRGKAESLHCPGPDVLAAYHERSLSMPELNSWKAHIAGCDRCQQILAHIETTDAVPLDVQENQNVVMMPVPEFAPQVRAATGSAVTAPAQRPSRPRSAQAVRWRWFAPAGAIAAGLLVWIALHESQLPHLSQPPVEEIAANRQTPSPLQAAKPAPASSAAPEALEKTLPRQRGAISNGRLSAGSPSTQAPAHSVDRIAPRQSPPSAALDRNAAAANEFGKIETSRDVNQPGLAARAELERKSKETLSAASENGTMAPPPVSVPAAPPPAGVTGAAETVAVTREAANAKKQTAEDAKSPAVGGAVSQFERAPSLRLAAAINQNQVAAHGGRTLWRFGASGMIEHSTDAGLVWKKQSSGVTTELLAGSAPSEEICWVVGRGGTILRTTDGGAHWIALKFLSADDLDRVVATDARKATVTSAATHNTFETADGGATWKQAPGE